MQVFGVPGVQPVEFGPHALPLPLQLLLEQTSVVVQELPSLQEALLEA